jgi:hypothetical protein
MWFVGLKSFATPEQHPHACNDYRGNENAKDDPAAQFNDARI